mmetsp:Transcript_22210/g.71438  ORF Transcript_22210/g.71438 Transcript_22210/m.71438 type:complete len:201 (+) Transcript_22210:392-994(+)
MRGVVSFFARASTSAPRSTKALTRVDAPTAQASVSTVSWFTGCRASMCPPESSQSRTYLASWAWARREPAAVPIAAGRRGAMRSFSGLTAMGASSSMSSQPNDFWPSRSSIPSRCTPKRPRSVLYVTMRPYVLFRSGRACKPKSWTRVPATSFSPFASQGSIPSGASFIAEKRCLCSSRIDFSFSSARASCVAVGIVKPT